MIIENKSESKKTHMLHVMFQINHDIMFVHVSL